MGKGTKHVRDWAETTLQVIIDARALYIHSVKIMENERVFPPANDFRGETLRQIHRDLMNVYLSAWDANRINVPKNPEFAEERLSLQRSAIASCRHLLALFELAKRQFHLEHGKYWNWMDMLVKVKNKLEAWHKSDVVRFGGSVKSVRETAMSEEASVEMNSTEGGARLNTLGQHRVVALA